MPFNCGEGAHYLCCECKIRNDCCWCGKTIQIPHGRKQLQTATTIAWQSISPEIYQKRKGNKRHDKCGFVPSPSDNVHSDKRKGKPNCFKHLCAAARSTAKKTPSSSTETEPPSKKPCTKVTVDLANKSPTMTQAERKVQQHLNNKSMVMVNGVGHVYQRGGKELIHTPKRTSMTPSDSALKRQRQTLLAAVASQIAPGQTQADVFVNLSRSRASVSAGVTKHPPITTADDDIDNWVNKLCLTLFQARTLVSECWKRHGFRFGQTINDHRAKKKERRLDTLYTTEETEQADGTTKRFHYKRVASISNLVANSIAILKKTGAFVAHDVGNKTTNIIPFGSALISPVVCCVFNLKTNPQKIIIIIICFLSGPGFVLD